MLKNFVLVEKEHPNLGTIEREILTPEEPAEIRMPYPTKLVSSIRDEKAFLHRFVCTTGNWLTIHLRFQGLTSPSVDTCSMAANPPKTSLLAQYAAPSCFKRRRGPDLEEVDLPERVVVAFEEWWDDTASGSPHQPTT